MPLKKVCKQPGMCFYCLVSGFFQAEVCPCLLLLPVPEVKWRDMKPLSKEHKLTLKIQGNRRTLAVLHGVVLMTMSIPCSLSALQQSLLPREKFDCSIWLWLTCCLYVFISFCLTGINDQGLYRVVGVSSKVQRLLSLLMGMPLFYNLLLLLFLFFLASDLFHVGLLSTFDF